MMRIAVIAALGFLAVSTPAIAAPSEDAAASEIVAKSRAVPPEEDSRSIVAAASQRSSMTHDAGVSSQPVAAVRKQAEASSDASDSNGKSSLSASVRCVAMAVYHEARGEPLKGQRAVADVVMNRVHSGLWGSTPCSVVDAPHQFSHRKSWSTPVIGVAAWDRAIDIARRAISGASVISSTLLYFRAARLGAGAVASLRIGHHLFW